MDTELVAMAPPLYTSAVKEKLYSCDDNGAHILGKTGLDIHVEGEYPGEPSHSLGWDIYGIASHYIVVGPGDETSLMPSPLAPPNKKWYSEPS